MTTPVAGKLPKQGPLATLSNFSHGEEDRFMFNGQQFPLEIQKLEPICVEFGGSILDINMKPANIFTKDDTLFISIQPAVTRKGGKLPAGQKEG